MLTSKEKELLEQLGECFNKFCKLEKQHPDDARDFADAIHDCQRIIIGRSAVREHPDFFYSYCQK